MKLFNYAGSFLYKLVQLLNLTKLVVNNFVIYMLHITYNINFFKKIYIISNNKPSSVKDFLLKLVGLFERIWGLIYYISTTSITQYPRIKEFLERSKVTSNILLSILIIESQVWGLVFINYIFMADSFFLEKLINSFYKVFHFNSLIISLVIIVITQFFLVMVYVAYYPVFFINALSFAFSQSGILNFNIVSYFHVIIKAFYELDATAVSFLESRLDFVMFSIKLNVSEFFENYYTQYPLFFYFGLLFLFSTIISLFFISFLGLYGVFYINIITLFGFWLSTFLAFNEIIYSNKIYRINLGRWFYLFFEHPVFFEFYVDSLSISYMLLTLTISFFVQIYTFSYFRFEPLVERLIIFLNLFIISMIFLVSSANTIMLFLGWELIGLTSFVLINFWVTRKATLKAAFKAFVFNKFSDISFFMFVILMYLSFFETDIEVINSQAYSLLYVSLDLLNIEITMVEFISMFIVFAAFIKSAQFGGHLWLPDSMEAPVPASALIHSATLVSAGLFLLLRFNVFFELSNYVYYIIPLVGSLTSFYGGLSAAFQSDIKRILAYSTISHCGFLMVSFSSYLFDFTLLYLYIHGFFKAGVFLCVGNVIRFSKNYQDFKRMGGYNIFLPFECYLTCVGLLNLGGLPFSLGFYMKHLLLTSIVSNNYYWLVVWTLCLFGALTGLFYSYKLYYYVFFDFFKFKKNIIYGVTRDNVTLDKIESTTKGQPSIYYTNTSLASNVAISGLFFIAYMISIYMYLYIKNSNLFSWDLSLLYNSQFTDLFIKNYNFLWNIGYYNLLAIICMVGLIFSFFRKIFNHTYVYNIFFILVVYSIFFFFFIILLS